MSDIVHEAESTPDVDVLIVGAGPTGLTLAAQLRQFGTRFRIVDRAPDQAHESRAVAVQARTVEVFDALGIADALVARGVTSARFLVHTSNGETAEVRIDPPLFPPTRYPFILMVSQAETEAVLGAHLAAHGVTIERSTVLEGVAVDRGSARCTMRRADGEVETVRARWVVGCDGAHSAVRAASGVAFEGDAYPQHYLLGDVEIDGPLDRDTIHAFPAGHGVVLCFPLRTPRSWRVIVIPGGMANEPPNDTDPRSKQPLTLAELQTAVDAAAGPGLHLRDPAWLTHFRLHHRQAAHYRAGPMFLAGDAAHIHSPVGAQGMNTGIQDAWNLGWKLALVAAGRLEATLLDAYEAERWPIGHALLRTTDRAFSLVTRGVAGGSLARNVRRLVVDHLMPHAARSSRLRSAMIHFASELDVRYRDSSAVTEGTPALRAGPHAGDRLPDMPVLVDGVETWLQRATVGPRLCILLCGSADGWDARVVDALGTRFGDLVVVRRLTTSATGAGMIVDADGSVMTQLGVTDSAQYVIRPDGHVGFRCAGRDLGAMTAYIERLVGAPATPSPSP